MTILCREGDIAIRPMRDASDDYDLMVTWRARPHVHQWWDPDDPPPTHDEVAEHYGPRSEGSRTTSCFIELERHPIGYIQFYRWATYPDDAADMQVPYDDLTFGLDVFIGEPELVGAGLGTRAVSLLCAYLFEELGASSIMLTTELTNDRAQRAYERAGFRKVGRVLDTDTREGERMPCWLMRRDAVS